MANVVANNQTKKTNKPKFVGFIHIFARIQHVAKPRQRPEQGRQMNASFKRKFLQVLNANICDWTRTRSRQLFLADVNL